MYRKLWWVFVVSLLPGLIIVTSAWTQVSPIFPQQTGLSRSSTLGETLRFPPLNPLGLPGSAYGGSQESNMIPISSGLFRGVLPEFRNLDFGFDLEWWSKSVTDGPVKGDGGNRLYARRLFLDYRPSLSVDAYHNFFLELHGESRFQRGVAGREDYSIGAAYRWIPREGTLLGVNSFIDLTRIETQNYSSWGWGVEFAYASPGGGLVDLTVNNYGNLFQPKNIYRWFRNIGTTSWDVEAGYTLPAIGDLLDLRIKANAYRFGNETVMMQGYKVGLDLSTKNRMATLTYEYGADGFRDQVHILRGDLSIPFQPELIFRLENPFSMPTAVAESDSGSSRVMQKMLTQRVRREWHQPGLVVATRTVSGNITVTRNSNIPLPDLRTTIDNMVVSGAPNLITKVIVTLNISHTYVADNVISLRSPSGTTIILFNHNDGGGDNWVGTVLDDDAAISIAAGSPPYTGTYRPIQPLSTFNGENPNGTWQLIFSDEWGADSGWLHSWSLTIEGSTTTKIPPRPRM